MATIRWCTGNGVKLIEPNENLAREYLDSAEETLRVFREIRALSPIWLATTKYYCEYFAFYAVLMRIGIKSEIHECTIALAYRLQELGAIAQGTAELLETDKQLRIDNQYYLKHRPVESGAEQLIDFVLSMKRTAERMTGDELTLLRRRIFKSSNVSHPRFS